MRAKYERKGKHIFNTETKQGKTYETVNEAKRESRKIQMAEDGGLGRGCLRLV